MASTRYLVLRALQLRFKDYLSLKEVAELDRIEAELDLRLYGQPRLI